MSAVHVIFFVVYIPNTPETDETVSRFFEEAR